MSEHQQDDALSPAARACRRHYLDEVRGRAHALCDDERDELVQEIEAHIDAALAERAGPVSLEAVEQVLTELGPPRHWLSVSTAPCAEAEGSRRAAGLAGLLAGGRLEGAIAAAFWGGLLLSGATGIPPVLPLFAMAAAYQRVGRPGASEAARTCRVKPSSLLGPPLLAVDALVWIGAVGFPVFLLLTFFFEESPPARALGGGSSIVVLSWGAALLAALLAAISRFCVAKPGRAVRVLPLTAALAARLPRRPLALCSALLLGLALAWRAMAA